MVVEKGSSHDPEGQYVSRSLTASRRATSERISGKSDSSDATLDHVHVLLAASEANSMSLVAATEGGIDA